MLRLAYDYDYDGEGTLGTELLHVAQRGELPTCQQLQVRFLPRRADVCKAALKQHDLSEYDGLLRHSRLSASVEVTHG